MSKILVTSRSLTYILSSNGPKAPDRQQANSLEATQVQNVKEDAIAYSQFQNDRLLKTIVEDEKQELTSSNNYGLHPITKHLTRLITSLVPEESNSRTIPKDSCRETIWSTFNLGCWLW